MKNLLLILGLILITNCCVNGQSVYNQQRIILDSVVYVCEKNKEYGGSIQITNENNILWKTKQNLPQSANDLSLGSINNSKEERLKILRKLFSNERVSQLKTEIVYTRFFIDDSGKVLELSFLLKGNSNITPNELFQIEKSFKKNLLFTFKNKELNGANFISFFLPVKFNEL